MRKARIIFLLIISSVRLYGAFVEYSSGDISYKYISGNCSSFIYYEITLNLTTGKKTAGDSVVVYYGDGDSSYIKRVDSVNIGNGLIKSRYKRIHAYSSCGDYVIYFYDQVNKQMAKNLNASNNGFFVGSKLYASPIYPASNCLNNYNSAATHVFKNKMFKFNASSSPDATFIYDSTVYSLYSTKVGSTFSLTIPYGVQINKYTGELIWNNPDTLGSFMIMILSTSYKYGLERCQKNQYHRFKVVSPTPSFVYDSLSTLPVNGAGYFEFLYNAGSTYTFCAKYKDYNADSVRIFSYPLDFFTTPIQYTYTVNNSKNHYINVNWSPTTPDIRDYPYNFVLNARSYYGADSVSNSYLTVDYRYMFSTIGINEVSLANSAPNLFPNPASSTLNILIDNKELENSEIEIINTLGQSVLNLPYKKEIDVSKISNGYYFLRITTSDKQIIHSKFIKE